MSKNKKDMSLDLIATEQGLITKKGLAELTTLSIKQIDRMRKDEGLPFLQIGRLVKFHPQTVVAWIVKNYQPKTNPNDL